MAGDAAAEGGTSIEHERASLLDIWETNVADADLFAAPTRLNTTTVVDCTVLVAKLGRLAQL